MPNELQELAEIVKKRSLRIGEFTLSSGKKAPYYLDCRMTTLDPRGAYLIARLVLSKMRELNIQADAIGGLTLGADPMAAAIAVVSGIEGVPLPGFIVRKETKDHGMGDRMLVVTGFMLGFVLVVMVGEEAQEMQLAHWLSTTRIEWLDAILPSWAGLWFAVFPTVETLVAQALAILLVLGSYILAGMRSMRRAR